MLLHYSEQALDHAVLLRRADDGRLAEQMREEAVQFIQRLDSPETAEAFAAFREKRAPDFTGFG